MRKKCVQLGDSLRITRKSAQKLYTGYWAYVVTYVVNIAVVPMRTTLLYPRLSAAIFRQLTLQKQKLYAVSTGPTITITGYIHI
ncbi:MAG: hypothetical protein JWM37_228 [Candidatus Saccharibacteria bacterium]|nr:hypothetical protein [Candidatus Saccharibacteria bacterium]